MKKISQKVKRVLKLFKVLKAVNLFNRKNKVLNKEKIIFSHLNREIGNQKVNNRT